jgi:hypothetical protein
MEEKIFKICQLTPFSMACQLTPFSYGRTNVFLDIDAIPAGVDFAEHLTTVLAEMDVFLAAIGPDWLDLLERREEDDDEHDFVVEELKEALSKDIPVIPLLLGGASIPRKESLPPEIASLSSRQAFKVDYGRNFSTDMNRLIEEMNSSFSKTR